MQPNSSRPELDPALEVASSVEQQHLEENERRAGIRQIINEERVPTFHQLEEAQNWSANLRLNGEFNDSGNLIQEDGLKHIDESFLDAVDSYFSEEKWVLGKREMALAAEINHNADRVGSGGLVGVIEKTSPTLAKELSESLDGLGTLERIDKLEAAKADISALVKLNAAIERDHIKRKVPIRATETDRLSAGHSAEEARLLAEATAESEKLIDAGLLGIKTEMALGAIDDAVASGEIIDFTTETVTGLSHQQKVKLLEHFGHKPKDIKPEINPRTLRPDMDKRERVRRFLNGSGTAPSVAARHNLENKAKLAQRKLDADSNLPAGSELGLSDRRRDRLEKRIEKSEDKIRRGSWLNSEKYGTGSTAMKVDGDKAIFTRSNIESSLQQLQRIQESIAIQRAETKQDADDLVFSLLADKLDTAFNRTANVEARDPAGPIIELNSESFEQITSDIEANFDSMIADKRASVPAGERLKDSDIEAVYIDAQLKVAKELTDFDFESRGVPKAGTHYTSRVRQMLEAFHEYKPAVEKAISFSKEVLVDIGEEITKSIRDDVRAYKQDNKLSTGMKLEKAIFDTIKHRAIERTSKSEVAKRFGLTDPKKIEAAVRIVEAELQKLQKNKK